jgi:hypothetical protein
MERREDGERETGLEPATSGVTGRMNAKDIKGHPKIAIKKSLAISIGLSRIWTGSPGRAGQLQPAKAAADGCDREFASMVS